MTWFWNGFFFFAGVTAFSLVLMVPAALVRVAQLHTSIGLDDSDFSPSMRSNLRVHTDARTGLQYLATAKGGIVPRLDRDGSQLSIPVK